MSLVRRVWPLIINTFSRHKPSSLCSTGSKHVFKHVSGYLNILPDALWPSRAHTVQRIKRRLSHSLSEFSHGQRFLHEFCVSYTLPLHFYWDYYSRLYLVMIYHQYVAEFKDLDASGDTAKTFVHDCKCLQNVQMPIQSCRIIFLRWTCAKLSISVTEDFNMSS